MPKLKICVIHVETGTKFLNIETLLIECSTSYFVNSGDYKMQGCLSSLHNYMQSGF